jgi:signal transduction histidine kinase
LLQSVSVLRDSGGNVTGYLTVYRDVTELKKAQDEVLRSREQLRELAVRMQQVLERERTTVAHDLHDRVTQGLTALKFDLDALRRRQEHAEPEVVDKLRKSIDLVEGLTATSRDIITELRPGMLDDLGLSAAIDWQLDQFSQRTGVRCSAALMRDDSSMSPVHATALFRVLQELLANVARHAEATEVSVSLESCDDSVVLTVRDNGRGIADEEAASADSFGLLGIHERVRALGGNFSIGCETDKKGTVACTRLPMSTPGPSIA